jgi:hypothetical protein
MRALSDDNKAIVQNPLCGKILGRAGKGFNPLAPKSATGTSGLRSTEPIIFDPKRSCAA